MRIFKGYGGIVYCKLLSYVIVLD